jgi:hypothetical protein
MRSDKSEFTEEKLLSLEKSIFVSTLHLLISGNNDKIINNPQEKYRWQFVHVAHYRWGKDGFERADDENALQLLEVGR